jgi:hypothetical protein
VNTIRDQNSCAKPLVSVAMITYNHEKFIAQAIEGVLMQETDFPIELVIGEDCSTDGTRQIVQRYAKARPDVIRLLLHETNVGMHANAKAVFAACRGEYIAACEGDDYWTCPDKLEIQVQLLEREPAMSMCGHTAVNFDQVSGAFTDEYPPPAARAPIHWPESFVRFQCFTRTSSVVIRSSMRSKKADSLKGLKMGDWPLFLLTSLNGPVGFIDRVMSCYRIHGGGVWTSSSEGAQCSATMEMWEQLLPILPAGVAALAREHLLEMYLTVLAQPEGVRRVARWRLAWRWFWSSLRAGHLRRGDLAYVLGTLFPRLLRKTALIQSEGS